jgi:hypothetical protein
MIIFSVLMELQEECHICIDGFIMHNLFPTIWVHLTCHDDIIARKRKAQTPLPEAEPDVKFLNIAASLVPASMAVP